MKFDISGFPKEHLPIVWEQVQPLIELGLEHADGEYTSFDFYTRISEGRMQLWIAADGLELRGIVVTEILHYPNKAICQIVLAAGTTVDKWEHCLDIIEQWAFELGVDAIRTYARPGFKRKAQKHGYDMQYCIYTKPLRIDHENTH